MNENAGTNDRLATAPAPSPRGARVRLTRVRLSGAQGRHRRPWTSLAAYCLLGAVIAALALPSAAPVIGMQTVAARAVSLTETWAQTLNDAGGPVAESSPNLANLSGGPAVVVGDRAGHVYGLSLANGAAVPGWPVSTGGVPVDSTPSVPLGAGPTPVFVGVGNAQVANQGGYMGISPQGGIEWLTHVQNPSTDRAPLTAVIGGLAVGNLEGSTDVVSGSLGVETQALNAANGGILPGYPWYQADTNFTTPALADLYGNSHTEVIEGGDSSAGFSYGQTYTNGGHLHVLAPTGNAFTGSPTGGQVCEYNTDQTIQSSPAVGEFLGGGGVGIAFGTGATFGGASTTDDLIAVNSHCGAQWIDKLDGVTTSSPALADVMGNGQLQVVEGTIVGSSGAVWALNGSNGATLWHTAVSGQVMGSVVTADLSGGGYQDVIVPTTLGVQILDGKTGQIVDTIATDLGFQNSALVTDDANGSIGITIAGYNNAPQGHQGVVEHYEALGMNGAGVNGTGTWPMFHHDGQLTGNAGTPPPVVQVPCSAPKGTPTGYDMAASDGGVFNYGNLPFCGSTGNLILTAPVVAIATTRDGGGYWMVASDGGMFAFDDAGFYGSMGGHPLARPVVGMAATPDGKGYWLVASDGGIFAFGDAGYYGSTGGHPLVKPVVGMAATPDGKGYWLVASDGGIFAFGDAHFYGSMGGHHLNRPVVGMAADDATGGYWMVATDGGVFSFNAPFLGSTGNIALARPVVGMQAAANGRGYRFVATDGGVFDYGEGFYGSTGGIPLVRPMVGMTGF
jgi:hypothetical protein